MIKKVLAIAACIAALALPVHATTLWSASVGDIAFPGLTPTTIDNMVIGGKTPAAGTFTTLSATQINAALGSYINNPASTSYYPQYTFAHGQTQLTFNIGSTTSYAYVTLEASPYDGQQACLFSTVAITTLYVYGNVGQTVNNAITTLAANAHACYQYSQSNTTWFRTQ